MAGLGLAATALAGPSQPPLVPAGELIDHAEELVATVSRGITSIAFSPDGKTLVMASGDAVRLWDLDSDTEVRRLQASPADVRSVAFSPDGKTLAAGCGDRVVLWDLAGGGVRSLEGHGAKKVGAQGIGALAFNPDGTILASGSMNSVIRLWNVADGTLIRQFGEPSSSGMGWRDLAFSRDGKTLAAVGTNPSVEFFDGTGQHRYATSSINIQIHARAVAFSPDGQILAAGGNHAVKLVEFPSGRTIHLLEKHEDEVLSVAFSADGKILASGLADRTLRLWDVARGTEIRRLEGHNEPVTAVAFQPGGILLASGASDGTRLWDPVSGTEVRRLGASANRVAALAISADGKTLAWGSEDGGISLWDLAGGIRSHRLEGGLERLTSLAFSPDGTTLASGAAGCTVTLWNLADGDEIRRLKAPCLGVSALAFSPDASILVAAESNNTYYFLKLWNVAEATEIRRIRSDSGVLALSPDGRTLATAHRDRTVRLWSLDGTEIRRLKLPGDWVSPYALAFTRGGRLVAAGTPGRAIQLWDVARGAEIRRLESRPKWPSAFAIRPDDNTLAIGDAEGKVRLWRRAPWSEPSQLLVEGPAGTWIACGDDGRCRRYDDGTLLARQHDDGSLEAVPPPGEAKPPALEVIAVPGRLDATDGQVTSFGLQLRNNGGGRAYWIHVERRPGAEEETLVFHPPPRIALLEPGQEVELTCGVSARATRRDPQGRSVPLELRITSAHGQVVSVEPIEVRVGAPSLVWNEARWSRQKGRLTLAVAVTNTGERDLSETEFTTELPGFETALDAVRESIPAGRTVTLEFPAPGDVELPSAVTVKAHQLGYPIYEWSFEDKPAHLPVPAWRRHRVAVLLLGAIAIGIGIAGYRRQWHQRLSARAWFLLAVLAALLVVYFTVDLTHPRSAREPAGEAVDVELVHEYFATGNSAVALEHEVITFRFQWFQQRQSEAILKALMAAAPENLWFESLRIESPPATLDEYPSPTVTLDGCAAEPGAVEVFSRSLETFQRNLQSVPELDNVQSSARQRQHGRPCFSIELTYQPSDLPEPRFRRSFHKGRWWETDVRKMERALPMLRRTRALKVSDHRAYIRVMTTESFLQRTLQRVRKLLDLTAAEVTQFETSRPLTTGSFSTLSITISLKNATLSSLVQLFGQLSSSRVTADDVRITVDGSLQESTSASTDFVAKVPFFTAAQMAAEEAREMDLDGPGDEEPR